MDVVNVTMLERHEQEPHGKEPQRWLVEGYALDGDGKVCTTVRIEHPDGRIEPVIVEGETWTDAADAVHALYPEVVGRGGWFQAVEGRWQWQHPNHSARKGSSKNPRVAMPDRR